MGSAFLRLLPVFPPSCVLPPRREGHLWPTRRAAARHTTTRLSGIPESTPGADSRPMGLIPGDTGSSEIASLDYRRPRRFEFLRNGRFRGLMR